MLIDAVSNQARFPGAGDVDDCWVVATWMCARAVRPDIPVGSITWMRGAANDPDDGVNDGGNQAEIMMMCQRMWPDIRVVDTSKQNWTFLLGRLKADLRPASIAVLSSAMPASYRFNFNGPHQIVAWWEDGALWMANPLAPQGAKPIKVDPLRIGEAAFALTGTNTARAVLFPTAAEAAETRLRYARKDLNAITFPLNKQIQDLKAEVTAAKEATKKAAIDAITKL